MVLITAVVLTIFGLSIASIVRDNQLYKLMKQDSTMLAASRAFIPETAKKISHNLYHLGEISGKGFEKLEGHLYIHTLNSNDTVHESISDVVVSPSTSINPLQACIPFSTSGAKWIQKENYGISFANLGPMSPEFFLDNMQTAFGAWNEQVAGGIGGSYDPTIVVDGFDTNAPDGKNEVMAGTVSEPGALALTVTWSGASNTGERIIVESDIIFNTGHYTFSDATVNRGNYDFLHVATHEAGHYLGGLPDIYLKTCSYVIMYGYTVVGEVLRTLSNDDITAITALYNQVSLTSGRPSPYDGFDDASIGTHNDVEVALKAFVFVMLYVLLH